MDPEIHQKLNELDKKIDAVYGSVERTRKYFLWTFVIALIAFVGPLLLLPLVLPSFLSTYGAINSIQ